MKKAEAERIIVELWSQWPDHDAPPQPLKGMQFHAWLVKEHPYVLEPFPGHDKWQAISALLSRHNLH